MASFIKVWAIERFSVVYPQLLGLKQRQQLTLSPDACGGLVTTRLAFGWTCWGRDAWLQLGEGSACQAAGSASSPTCCCSFMFSWGGNPCCSPDNGESCPRSTAIINITTAGFLRVFITSVPCCWVCCPIWRAHLEMLGGDWQRPCLLFEGSCGVAKWWELVTRVRRGMATLERREEDGTFGVLCYAPLQALTGPLPGNTRGHPHGTYSALPAFWGLCL